MFRREIKTRPLDASDYETLKDTVRIVEEDGTEHAPTLEELNESGMSRITASRNILTGEWEEKAHSKTHDGKELPFFVVKAG